METQTTLAPVQPKQNPLLSASQQVGAAVMVALFAVSSVANAGTLDVTTLQNDLEGALTEGRDAGKNLTCTATMVFFDSDFMKFVFGGMLLISIVMAAFAWWNQSRNGVGMGRIFWLIVIVMAVVALIATITTTFMAC